MGTFLIYRLFHSVINWHAFAKSINYLILGLIKHLTRLFSLDPTAALSPTLQVIVTLKMIELLIGAFYQVSAWSSTVYIL